MEAKKADEKEKKEEAKVVAKSEERFKKETEDIKAAKSGVITDNRSIAEKLEELNQANRLIKKQREEEEQAKKAKEAEAEE